MDLFRQATVRHHRSKDCIQALKQNGVSVRERDDIDFALIQDLVRIWILFAQFLQVSDKKRPIEA